MPITLAIVNIGQLVTLAGPSRPRTGAELRELGVISNAALLIEDNRITAAGSYADLRPRIPSQAVIVDAAGRCVTPGFVDAHTHLVFAGNRAAEFEQRIAGATYQQIAATGGGIGAFAFPFLMSALAQNWGIRAGFATYAIFAVVMTLCAIGLALSVAKAGRR